jgi:dihydroorotate dehydrogenase (NAD+) catalytic subunit
LAILSFPLPFFSFSGGFFLYQRPFIVFRGAFLHKFSPIYQIRVCFTMFKANLNPGLGFVDLKNPVIAASGTFGYGLELLDFSPPEELGAVIPKGLSRDPWDGNPGVRACEAAGGLINAIGLENMGIKRFLKEVLPKLKARGAVVGVNILGKTLEEYQELCEKLSDTNSDFIELNISCPNLKHKGGLSFGADPNVSSKLIKASVQKARDVPVVVKLPPLVSDITLLAKIAEDSGAKGISLINSLPALAIDIKTKKPKLHNITGGLTGPPIKPLALRQVYLASKSVSIPVIGLGGILTAEDALEFFLAGAKAVEIGTATLVDPRAPIQIRDGIEAFLNKEGLDLQDFQRLSIK